MKNCNQHWCENYEKNNAMCDNCMKKENDKDFSDLRVVINKRQTEKVMQINQNQNNQRSINK